MLGKRIQTARKAQGLSLRELAEKVGLSHAAIKKVVLNWKIYSLPPLRPAFHYQNYPSFKMKRKLKNWQMLFVNNGT